MSQYTMGPRSRDSGAARLWRGWTGALLAVLIAAGGRQAAHSVTHGVIETIPWELFGLAIALTALIAVALAGKHGSTWPIGLSALWGQMAFHLLYSLPYTGTSSLFAGHHQGHRTALVATQMTHATPPAHSAMSADVVMVSVHVLAAALTIWIIVYGERSHVRIASWVLLMPVKLVLTTAPIRLTRPRPWLFVGKLWIPDPRNFIQTRWIRGPPVSSMEVTFV